MSSRATIAVPRSTAPRQRARAIESGLRAVADQGLTTRAIQQVADEIGVSQPYVFRLFGSKRAFLFACLDEFEARIDRTFREAAAITPDDPLESMAPAFRDLMADGVLTGLWLQASAAARGDDVVARRCRDLIAGVLAQTGRLTGAAPEDLTPFLARGALVVLLQAIGVDLSHGTRAAVGTLTGVGTPAAEGVSP